MGFNFFARNSDINIDKYISKILTTKYTQKLHEDAKQSATDALKSTSIRVIQKMAETTRDLIGNNIADKITNVSKNLQQINSNENYKKIPKERYIYIYIYISRKRQEIIDDLRLK